MEAFTFLLQLAGMRVIFEKFKIPKVADLRKRTKKMQRTHVVQSSYSSYKFIKPQNEQNWRYLIFLKWIPKQFGLQLYLILSKMMRLCKTLKASLVINTTQNPNYFYFPGTYLTRVSFPGTNGTYFSEEIPYIPNFPYTTPTNPQSGSAINISTTPTVNNQFKANNSVRNLTLWYGNQRDLSINLLFNTNPDYNFASVILSAQLS